MAVWHSVGRWGQGKAFNAILTFEGREKGHLPLDSLLSTVACFSLLPTPVERRGLDQSPEVASSPSGGRALFPTLCGAGPGQGWEDATPCRCLIWFHYQTCIWFVSVQPAVTAAETTVPRLLWQCPDNSAAVSHCYWPSCSLGLFLLYYSSWILHVCICIVALVLPFLF